MVIIHNLLLGKSPNPEITFRESMYQWYDRTVLEVIISKKMQGKDIFYKMFKKLSIEQILKFLGNVSLKQSPVSLHGIEFDPIPIILSSLIIILPHLDRWQVDCWAAIIKLSIIGSSILLIVII